MNKLDSFVKKKNNPESRDELNSIKNKDGTETILYQ